jgi:hypothetical protein
MSTAVADADDLEDEAPRQPTRRNGLLVAVPNAPIPPELNAEFLADLAFERALSAARNLASGFSGSTDLSAEARRAVWGQPSPSEATERQPNERIHDRSTPHRNSDLHLGARNRATT